MGQPGKTGCDPDCFEKGETKLSGLMALRGIYNTRESRAHVKKAVSCRPSVFSCRLLDFAAGRPAFKSRPFVTGKELKANS
jgi:hypothetical protein